ncbi:MAG: TonB-dependent receptor [Prevotella sp.]|jgi:outer membrane receptor for ferrienterochelin and colicin|nr:TonB-dependent receptor [Prevotella sp.]MCH4216932.1 TonB-dependent receptor [Prevotella sp.]
MKRNFLSAIIILSSVPVTVPVLAQTQQEHSDSTKMITVTGDMQKKTYQLQGVTVTGSAILKPIKISPVTTQVLEGKALADAGYCNLQQVLLMETPGMNIQKVGFGNELNMDGLDARHVLFLVDGERMTGDMAGNLDYERFNLHAIDHIEIIKGGSSTLYGSMSSGAVINMITKKTDKPVSIEAGVRWGQMNERNYKNPKKRDFLYMFEKDVDKPNLQTWVSAGLHQGKVTSQTDVCYSSSDAFNLYQKKNDTKTYTAKVNKFLDHDVTVTSTLPRPPMGVEGDQHVSLAQRLYYEPFRGLHLQADGTAFFMNTYDMIPDLVFTQSKDFSWGAQGKYDLKDWLDITAGVHTDFYYRYKRHERRNERRKVYNSRVMEPRLVLESHYFKGHDLQMGLDYFGDRLTSDRFVNRKMTSRSLKETECYLQDEWVPSDKWMFSLGVRTNFSHQFGFMWMPKIAAKYNVSDHLALRADYSMGYRSPSIKELFFNWDHLGMFMIKGNEYLKPEKNNYFSLGAEYNRGDFFLNGTVYANLFRHKIEGVWRIYDMQYNFEYTNLDNQTLAGTDWLMKWKFLRHWLMNASCSCVYVSKENGLQFNTTSPYAATAGLAYSCDNHMNYGLRVNLNASLMGEKTYDVQDRLTVDGISHKAYFRCRLPAYVLCNLNVLQNFGSYLKVYAGVNNLFNYKPKTLGSGLTAFSVPATAGARVYVQMEVKLDALFHK